MYPVSVWHSYIATWKRTYQVFNYSWPLNPQELYSLQYIYHLLHFKSLQYGEYCTESTSAAKNIAVKTLLNELVAANGQRHAAS